MNMDTLTLIFFAVNLTYIVTNVYGYLLKRFFVPEIYRKDAAELFPARRSVAQFYLLQLFEVPYLFMMGRPEALFYVNGTGLLVFSSFILVIVRRYFFLQTSSLRKRLLFLLPMWACWVALFVPLIVPTVFTPRYQWTMTIIVLVLFVGYMFHLERFRKQLMDRVRQVDEDEYSNEDDFPATFARSIRWLPFVLCALLAVNFLLNDALVKMVRDLIFTVIGTWFAIYTLNPHRKIKKLPMKLKMEEQEEVVQPKYHLTEQQRKDMEIKMLACLTKEQLFLEDHFTMNDLMHKLGTNKTYLSEVIARSDYKSFYQLVNTLRLEHACQMLDEQPGVKLEQVAFASGFTSGSAFSQVFKRLKGITPTEYLHQKE